MRYRSWRPMRACAFPRSLAHPRNRATTNQDHGGFPPRLPEPADTASRNRPLFLILPPFSSLCSHPFSSRSLALRLNSALTCTARSPLPFDHRNVSSFPVVRIHFFKSESSNSRALSILSTFFSPSLYSVFSTSSCWLCASSIERVHTFLLDGFSFFSQPRSRRRVKITFVFCVVIAIGACVSALRCSTGTADRTQGELKSVQAHCKTRSRVIDCMTIGKGCRTDERHVVESVDA